MKLIHLTLIYPKGFENQSKLVLWLESSRKSRRKKFYSYSCDNLALDEFIKQNFPSHILRPYKLELDIPLNKEDEEIPSPLIANTVDLEDKSIQYVSPTNINSLAIFNILSFIKDLHFATFYFDDDIQLADDAKFWIKVVKELNTVIKHDQYIKT